MQIAVVGTGYVGLVTGVCLSEFGFRVTCVDRDADKIAKLQQHIMPIFEPGLDKLIESNRKAARLSFSTDLAQSVAQADIVFIAVGTPQNETDGMPDLKALHAATKEIAKSLKDYTLVITKSTVPVGTNRQLVKIITEINPEADFDVASNPEFLREGAAIEDFMSPERIVVGIDSKRAKDVITKLYEPICLNGANLFFTTFESAETIKYVTNSMLATRIAMINEIADFCEKTGANIRDVAKGVGMDYRIGEKFLQPGPGYGGSCFPKDTMALQQMARTVGCNISIVEATIESNAKRKLRMVDKIVSAVGGEPRNISGKTIAVLGLTFKPGTDDMREGASLVIVPELLKAGATIRTYDPHGMKEAAKILSGNITWCEDAYEAMEEADGVVILTEWNEFRSLDLKKVKTLLRTPLVVDLRNIYKRQDMMVNGFHYVSIGRQDVIPGQPWISDLNMQDEKAA
jgi:UDPglucose 6-dehydrogenase